MPDHRGSRRRGERNPRVELIYDLGCPHVDEARVEISAALRDEGLPLHWEEWGQAVVAEGEPTFGSPTVIVNGRDVASGDLARPGKGSRCRVYPDGNTVRGAPPRETIRRALRASEN